jgi:hypothetical protein
MGDFGFTLDLNNSFIYGWGPEMPMGRGGRYDLEYMTNLNIGIVGRGYSRRKTGDYSVGGDFGVGYLYSYAYPRGGNILTWNAGAKFDTLLGHRGRWADGILTSLGWKAERYEDGSIENGFYASALFLANRADDSRCIAAPLSSERIQCARRSFDIVQVLEYNQSCVEHKDAVFAERMAQCDHLLEEIEDQRQSHPDTDVATTAEREMWADYEDHCSYVQPPDYRDCEVMVRHDITGVTTGLSLGIGLYLAFFPGSERGEAGFSFIIGFDPFLI